jgi:hypothetical protein
LKQLIIEDDKARWKRIAKAINKSDVGCEKRGKQLGLSK